MPLKAIWWNGVLLKQGKSVRTEVVGGQEFLKGTVIKLSHIILRTTHWRRYFNFQFIDKDTKLWKVHTVGRGKVPTQIQTWVLSDLGLFTTFLSASLFCKVDCWLDLFKIAFPWYKINTYSYWKYRKISEGTLHLNYTTGVNILLCFFLYILSQHLFVLTEVRLHVRASIFSPQVVLARFVFLF